MKQTQRAIINISVPQSMAKEITKTAKEEDKTISELLRQTYLEYKTNKEWARLRKLGEETALKMGIKSFDDIERIAG